MSNGLGYLYWSSRVLGLGMYVGGRRIKGGLVHPSGANYSRSPAGSIIPTLGNSDVTQLMLVALDAPMSIQPINTKFSLSLSLEDDYHVFLESHTHGEPVDIWYDLIISDVWSIRHNPSGLLWKTSRKLPYGLSFVTTTNRPPRAFIDSVEQTVVHTSPPAAGEVYVPNVGGYATIETPDISGGRYLTLKYHPIVVSRVIVDSLTHEDVNDLRMNVAIEEVRQRLFT